tara:strand:- start:1933 stop:2226 length:294 start_codon:yes stop_codon:yes gene_type:complete
MRDKITVTEWITFNAQWVRIHQYAPERFGQKLINDYNLVSDQGVFYCEDHIESVHRARVRYVDMDTSNPESGTSLDRSDWSEKLKQIQPCETAAGEL